MLSPASEEDATTSRMNSASSDRQSLGSGDHPCHDEYHTANRRMRTEIEPSHQSLRSISSVALDQLQYIDSTCREDVDEL